MTEVIQYTPREMIEALRQSPRPTTFLSDLFIRRTTTHDTDVIEIDIEKGSQRIAPYVARAGEADRIGKRAFSTNLHAIPYLKMQKDYTPRDLRTRLPGNTIYDGPSPQQMMDQKIGRDLGQLEDMIIVREEQQVAQGLQTGKVTVAGKDVNYIVDFQMASANKPTLTGNDRWSESATRQIRRDLRAWSKVIQDTGAPTPTMAVMDAKAAGYYMADADVLKYMDLRRVDLGEIVPRVIAGQRATYLGTLRDIGLDIDIYVYQGSYVNESDVATNFMTDNTVVLGSQAVRVEKHYGIIENFKHGTMVGERFALDWTEDNGSARHISLESGPLVALHQPDGIVAATVV